MFIGFQNFSQSLIHSVEGAVELAVGRATRLSAPAATPAEAREDLTFVPLDDGLAGDVRSALDLLIMEPEPQSKVDPDINAVRDAYIKRIASAFMDAVPPVKNVCLPVRLPEAERFLIWYGAYKVDCVLLPPLWLAQCSNPGSIWGKYRTWCKLHDYSRTTNPGLNHVCCYPACR